jgi:hypothetical protein
MIKINNNKLIILILGVTAFLTITLATLTFLYIIQLINSNTITNELLITLLSIVSLMFGIGTNIVSGLIGYLGGQKQNVEVE